MATLLKPRNRKTELRLAGEGHAFRHDISDYIEGSALFSNLSHEEAYELSDWFKAYDAEAGTEIISEGQKNPCLCLLVKGKLDVFKETNAYERRRIASIQPGRSFGEMAMVDEQPSSATVVAAEDSLILMITSSNFSVLMEHHPSLGNKLLLRISRMISLRLRQTTGQLVDFLDHQH